MKPADFLIGVLDFFAVLLPGSIATWLLSRYVSADDAKQLLTVSGWEPSKAVRWSAFLISAYVLGHFVWMAGSWLDETYDVVRPLWKPKSRDHAFQAAWELRTRVNVRLVDDPDFTLLKWAKAFVRLHAGAAALSDIDRLEANSKFFRSLVVVAIAIAIHFALLGRWGLTGAAALILVLAYARYVGERWKAAQLTYATAVILDATTPAPGPDAARLALGERLAG